MADTQDINAFVAEVLAGPDDQGENGWHCRHCHQTVELEYDSDPTPLCHDCAHDFAVLAAEEINTLRSIIQGNFSSLGI